MDDNHRGRAAATDWPLAYLNITAVSVGVLVGVWHWFPEAMRRYELVPIGFIVGMYAVASALHYYQVTRNDRVSAVAVDEQ
jgi:hypothetical protein